MEVIELSHVVVLTHELEESVRQFSRLGLDFGSAVETSASGEPLASAFTPLGLELLTPRDPDGDLARYLEEHGPGLYALAMRVVDLEAAKAALADDGLTPVGGFSTDSLSEAYYHPAEFSGVLLILIEYPGDLTLEAATRRHASN